MRVHFFLSNKGGCGKTTSCWYFSQYLNDKGNNIIVYDADPQNKTLLRCDYLKVKNFDLMDAGSYEVNRESFINLIEEVAEYKDVIDDIIVDVGANGFYPFQNFLFLEDGITTLNDYTEVFIHYIIAGGRMSEDCLVGLNVFFEYIDKFKKDNGDINLNIIIWEDEFFGNINFRGKKLSDTAIFIDNKDKIYATINCKNRTENYNIVIEKLLNKNLTFSEAINGDSNFKIIEKSWLKTLKTYVYNQLSNLDFPSINSSTEIE